MYIPDIFYETNHLSIDQKKKLLLDAKEKSYDWHVDKLDCNASFARQKQKYFRFNKIIKMFEESKFKHFVFINRKGFVTPQKIKKLRMTEFCIETGIRISDPNNVNIDYFLFIYINEKHLEFFIKKYRLKLL